MPASFVFDPNKCTGCHACQLACTIENGLELGRSWRRVDTYNPRRHPGAPLLHLSMACNHCAQAPCMRGCPAAAYRRDARTGAVLLDPDRCLGCKYCAWVCPFDAPSYDPTNGVMTKCTFCLPRLTEQQEPACVALCPTGALGYAELTTDAPPDAKLQEAELPDAELSQALEGFPQTNTRPSLKIVPSDRRGVPPELTAPAGTGGFDARDDLPASRISLRSEWSLAVFTTLAGVLVAVWTAAGLRPGALALEPTAFGAAALVGLGLNAVHLGRRRRAPRAVVHLTGSWLSREVLLVTLFAGLATAALAWPGSGPLGVAGRSPLFSSILAGLGFAGLIAIDRVYQAVQRPELVGMHSAQTVLTGLFLAGVWGQQPLLAGATGWVKLVLYCLRKLNRARRGESWRPGVSVARVLVGLVMPAWLWFLRPLDPGILVLAGTILGEGIDRCEYYDELEVVTPARQMALDLARRLEKGVLS